MTNTQKPLAELMAAHHRKKKYEHIPDDNVDRVHKNLLVSLQTERLHPSEEKRLKRIYPPLLPDRSTIVLVG